MKNKAHRKALLRHASIIAPRKNAEKTMTRSAALAPSLDPAVLASGAPATVATEVEVNGVRLPYVEQGCGEPVIFVHGALSDLRAWEPARAEIAKREAIASRYRFIAYSQRYYGPHIWKDNGTEFSVATHADDLAKLIVALDAGPVHLVGTSYGGLVATTAAVKSPSLVRSLILYEPALVSVLPESSEDGKAARKDRAEFIAPVISALNAGGAIQAARLMYEAVNQLPPGGFDREPQATQTRVLDNARTLPLMFATLPSSTITGDMLKDFARPTLVMRGEKTQVYYALINEAVSRCIPRARQVILKNADHGGPYRDPAAFTAPLLGFLLKG
jgi:pimeloyl-ACP methyl ester carboxylesterase